MNKFLKWSTWRMIIQSRTTDYKNSKTDWCKERREICKKCNHNSVHYPTKTFKEYLLRFLNMGNYCLCCWCGIQAKTRNAYSTCGLVELNEPPKWEKINLNTKYQNAN